MGMMNEGFSIADAMALAKSGQNEGEGFSSGNGTWIWVFFLFFLLAWGGNGFGFGNNSAATTAAVNANGALTRADLCQDMNFQQLQNDTRSLQSGLCDGFYAMNTSLLNGFNGVQRDLCSGFNGINQNINQTRFDVQATGAGIGRSIDNVKYENAQNTCDIVNAIRADGEATRALINSNTMQDLRDRLESKDRELLSAQFQISQQAQTSNIVNQVKPCAIPAYVVGYSENFGFPYVGLNNLNGNSGGCCA